MPPKANRFEKLARKYKKKLAPFNYVVRIVGVVVILLLLLELASFLAVNVNSILNRGNQDSRINADVYDDKEWATDLFLELRESRAVEYYPYTGYRRVPSYYGTYVNIDANSIRKTINPCVDDAKPVLSVFMFGGSTLWGTGARDVGTIASHVSEDLCEAGYNVEVTNFGQTGYVNFQELILLQLALRDGNVPDIVAFYDGVNDVHSTYQNLEAGFLHNQGNRRAEFNSRNEFRLNAVLPHFHKILDRIVKNAHFDTLDTREINQELIEDTAAVYLSHIDLITSLEREYEFDTFFFWQPSIYTKGTLSEFEQSIPRNHERHANDFKAITNLVLESKEVVDLTRIFEGREETIYVDLWHISEEGNALVAEHISEDLVKHMRLFDRYDEFAE